MTSNIKNELKEPLWWFFFTNLSFSTDSYIHEEHLHVFDGEHRRGGGNPEESGWRKRTSRSLDLQSFQHHQERCQGKELFLNDVIIIIRVYSRYN